MPADGPREPGVEVVLSAYAGVFELYSRGFFCVEAGRVDRPFRLGPRPYGVAVLFLE